MNPAIEIAWQAVCGRLLGELVADLVERLLSERLLDEPAGMLLDDVGFGYDLLTASYIIDIKSLAPAFESGKRLTGSIRFDEGRFPVVVTVDLTEMLRRIDPPDTRRARGPPY